MIFSTLRHLLARQGLHQLDGFAVFRDCSVDTGVVFVVLGGGDLGVIDKRRSALFAEVVVRLVSDRRWQLRSFVVLRGIDLDWRIRL